MINYVVAYTVASERRNIWISVKFQISITNKSFQSKTGTNHVQEFLVSVLFFSCFTKGSLNMEGLANKT